MQALPSTRYCPDSYSALPAFDLARQVVDRGQESVGSIGDVICAHGLHDILGVGLLHKHFEMNRTEALVRRGATDGTLARPEMAPLHRLLPYVWKYDERASGGDWLPLEFFDSADPAISNKVALASERISLNSQFLQDAAAEMRSRKTSTIFGISILNSSFFQKTHDEIFLETTDDTRRELTVRRRPSTEASSASVTQTQWSFGGDTEMTSCSNHGSCSGHCGHCSHTKCSGHCFHS